MSQKVTAFRTDDGLLEIEVGGRAVKAATVRIAHDEMLFERTADFDEWIKTLSAARDEFTAVRAT